PRKRSPSLCHLSSRRLADRVDDADVGAAAAQVAAHALLDLGVGQLEGAGASRGHRARHAGAILGEHPNRRADLSGRAVAALEAVVLDEGHLERVRRVLAADAFDRRYLAAPILNREGEARDDALAVD